MSGTRKLAVVVDGSLLGVDEQFAVVNPSTSSAVDEIVSHLGRVVMLAQHLSAADQRRVRDFTHAAASMLSATTYLPTSDQKVFDTALRAAARDITER